MYSLLDSWYKVKQAEEAYRKAIEIEPTLPAAYSSLLQLLVGQDRTDEAFQVCHRMVQEPKLAYDACGVLGSLFVAQEKYRNAEEVYHRAIGLHPEHPDAYVALMQLLVTQKRIDDAFQVSRRMAQQPELAHRAFVELGDLLAPEKQYAEAAERAYRHAIELNSSQADGYIGLARLYLDQEESTSAEQSALQAQKIAPNNPDACFVLAQVYQEQGNLDEAITFYHKTAEFDPEPVRASEAFGLAGTLALDQGRYPEAEELLRNAISYDVENVQATYDLGRLLELQKKFEQAGEMYTRATSLAPKFGEAYLGRARIYTQLGDVPSLSRMAQELMALDLEPAEKYAAHLIIAATYRDAELYEWAVEELNRAVVLEPNRLDAYMGLGPIYELQSRWERALDTYNKIAELDPESELDVRLRRGAIYIQQNDYAAAAEAYNSVIELVPERIDGYLALADLHETLGQWDEAIQCYHEAAEVQPDATAASAIYERIGDLLLQQERFAEAEKVLQQALQRDPNNAGAHFSLGVVAERQNDLDSALAMYAKARLLNPRYRDAAIALGRIYGEQGNEDALTELVRNIQAIEWTPAEQYDAQMFIAAIYQAAEDSGQAEQTYRQIIEASPKRTDAYVQLMHLLSELGQLEEAIQLCHHMAQQPELAYNAYVSQGNLLFEQEKNEEAEDAYRLAIEADPQQPEPYLRLADIYQLWNESDKAKQSLQQGAEIVLNNPELHLMLAQLAEQQEQWEEARDKYEKVALLAPDLAARAHQRMGDLFAQEGKMQDAENEFRQTINLAPEHANGYFALAQLLVDAERWQDSIQVFEDVAMLGVDQATHAYLEIAAIYRNLGNVDHMREACAKVVSAVNSTDLPDYHALRRKGLAYLMCSAYAHAGQALGQAIEANPADFQARFYLALSLLGQGNRTQAQRELEQGIELTQHAADYQYAIQEAEALAEHTPEVAGARAMLEAFVAARERLAA